MSGKKKRITPVLKHTRSADSELAMTSGECSLSKSDRWVSSWTACNLRRLRRAACPARFLSLSAGRWQPPNGDEFNTEAHHSMSRLVLTEEGSEAGGRRGEERRPNDLTDDCLSQKNGDGE